MPLRFSDFFHVLKTWEFSSIKNCSFVWLHKRSTGFYSHPVHDLLPRLQALPGHPDQSCLRSVPGNSGYWCPAVATGCQCHTNLGCCAHLSRAAGGRYESVRFVRNEPAESEEKQEGIFTAMHAQQRSLHITRCKDGSLRPGQPQKCVCEVDTDDVGWDGQALCAGQQTSSTPNFFRRTKLSSVEALEFLSLKNNPAP